MPIEVRPGSRDDLPAVVRIYNHYVEATAVSFDLETVRTEDRVAWLEEHSREPHRLWVATDDRGEVAGWSTSSPFRPRPAYRTTVEVSVYCRPDRLGRGIGSSLYRALLDNLSRQDVASIVAGITLPNPASLALHRKFGFRPVGTFTRVGRKFDRYWDVAWFERPNGEPRTAEGVSPAV